LFENIHKPKSGTTVVIIKKRTIIVDLDGTLVNTDMLVENLFLFLRLHPLRIFEVIAWLFKGKAHFKRYLADAVVPDVSRLPYNKDLLAFSPWWRAALPAPPNG
jgi:hypothetical protein